MPKFIHDLLTFVEHNHWVYVVADDLMTNIKPGFQHFHLGWAKTKPIVFVQIVKIGDL